MYICICYGITDSDIKEAIADGATTRAALGERLGAGTCCGQCQTELDDLLISTPPAQAIVPPTPTVYRKPSPHQ